MKLGKREAIVDDRIPRFSLATNRLPTPPPFCNWYAAIGDWPLLKNDEVGNCVIVAIGHAMQQFSAYAGSPIVMTEQEAVETYSLITGYDPANPMTDRGTYVMGQTGAMQYWLKNGIHIGGTLTKVHSYMRITHKDQTEWMQGISIFGGLLVGISVPASLMMLDPLPYVWEDQGDGVPSAGGHEIWINGYQEVAGQRLYDLISWGGRYRATEQFLLRNVDEVVVVYDEVSLNARGVDGAGMTQTQLLDSMRKLV